MLMPKYGCWRELIKEINNVTELDIAKTVATMAHWSQRRRTGEPYIMHPEAVASKVEGQFKPLAWLHDVIEDVPWMTYGMLEEVGIKAYTIQGLHILTRFRQEPYREYIDKIAKSNHEGAIIVKLADLDHNLSTNAREFGLAERYQEAQVTLEAALKKLEQETF